MSCHVFLNPNYSAANRWRRLRRAHLAHEVGDNSVEGGAPEAEALLAGAESPEVLGRLRDDIGAQLQRGAEV